MNRAFTQSAKTMAMWQGPSTEVPLKDSDPT